MDFHSVAPSSMAVTVNGFDVGIFTAIKLLRLTHKRSLEFSNPVMTDGRVFRCSFPSKNPPRGGSCTSHGKSWFLPAVLFITPLQPAEKYDIFSARARLGKSFNVLKWRSVVSYVAAIFLWAVSFCEHVGAIWGVVSYVKWCGGVFRGFVDAFDGLNCGVLKIVSAMCFIVKRSDWMDVNYFYCSLTL